MSWRISGSYFESCNCDPICPCRRIDGVPGGRSTYGECLGVLSWVIERGHADDVSLDGLAVALATRYHDDEPGSPWSFVVYLDAMRIAVRPVEIAVSHEPRRQWLRIRDHVSLRIRDRHEGPETVTCVIPGHDRAGEELVADELRVADGPLRFDYEGNCGYSASFDYAG